MVDQENIEIIAGTPPPEWGLPDEFASWRRRQPDAVAEMLYCPERFLGLCAPTGFGKTIAYISQAIISARRTAVLTVTKPLMDQLARNFGACGLADIRGRANYTCRHWGDMTCDEAEPVCRYAGEPECSYRGAYLNAKIARIPSSNYAYWMAINKRASLCLEDADGTERNPFEVLVLDEAHSAADELARFLQITVSQKEMNELAGSLGEGQEVRFAFERLKEEGGEELSAWKKTARDLKGLLAEKVLSLVNECKQRAPTPHLLKSLRKLQSLLERMERIAALPEEEDSDWVIEWFPHERVWRFDPVWPGRYAEGTLFKGIRKVVLLSGTLCEQSLWQLGIGKGEYAFKSYPYSFDRRRCPVYYLPVRALTGRVSRAKQEENLYAVLEVVDEILDGRRDRKGIIHTGSFDRQEFVRSNSRHARDMIGNDRFQIGRVATTINQAVDRYRASKPPTILVSPSVHTGWDFPMSECEYIIWLKLPFPPAQSKVMKIRCARDKNYRNHITAQALAQGCGRGMRSEEDQCEVFLLDKQWGWFRGAAKRSLPQWFVVNDIDDVPEAPPALRTRA